MAAEARDSLLSGFFDGNSCPYIPAGHLAGHIYVRPDSFLGKFVSVVYRMDMRLITSISFFPYADKRNLFTKLPWILRKFYVNAAKILQ